MVTRMIGINYVELQWEERRSQREASKILKESQAVWCCAVVVGSMSIWLTVQSWNPDFVPCPALNLWRGISHVWQCDRHSPWLEFPLCKTEFIHPKPEEAVFNPGSVPRCFSGSLQWTPGGSTKRSTANPAPRYSGHYSKTPSTWCWQSWCQRLAWEPEVGF